MKNLLFAALTSGAVLLGSGVPAQQPATNYDESKVPAYKLPDLLVTKGGDRVRSAADWATRRAEVKSLLETQMFGRAPGRPDQMRFEVAFADRHLRGRR